MVHTFGTSDTFIIIYMISAAAICTALNPYRAMLTYAFTRAAAHTQLILGSALFGMIGLIFGQLIVERIFVYAIPVSVFITVGGGIYFLYLLLAGKRA